MLTVVDAATQKTHTCIPVADCETVWGTKRRIASVIFGKHNVPEGPWNGEVSVGARMTLTNEAERVLGDEEAPPCNGVVTMRVAPQRPRISQRGW